MANLTWQIRNNLENTLKDFIESEISSESLTVEDEYGNAETPQVYVGWQKTEDWVLPNISLYVDSTLSPRLSIGSNKRQNEYLLIIDIRCKDVGQQLNLTDWLTDKINNGIIFYEYTPDGSGGVNRTSTGYVSFDFISNVPVRLGDNVDLFDKYRQNITISCTITPTS